VVDTARLAPVAVRAGLDRASRANPLHAMLARTLAAAQLAAGAQSVAMIAPYRAQARLLAAGETEVEGLRAATVHRVQGDEADAVVVDLVDAYPFVGPSRLTGGGEPDLVRRLLTVACSRPRGKLVLLVDRAFVRRTSRADDPVPTLIAAALRRGELLDAGSLPLAGTEVPGITWLDAGAGTDDVRHVRGRDAASPVARVDDPALLAVLRDLLLGPAGRTPSPATRSDGALDDLFGDCAACGELRRPRGRGTVWAVGCSDPAHGAERLVAADGARLAEALDVRCPECGARALAVPTRAGGVRFACPREQAGCPGEPPSLGDLFAPRRPAAASR
jgi:hypothetical protein